VPPAPQVREPSALTERHWYGWQTLASDGASLGLMLAGIVTAAEHAGLYDDETPVMANVAATLGLAGYAAGAPVMHLVHERPGAAAASLGLRLALPLLGGALGAQSQTCPPPSTSGDDYGNCGLGGLVLGLSAGVLAAVIIDATALSFERVEAEPPAGPRLSFAPVISNDGKRGELRVFGTF